METIKTTVLFDGDCVMCNGLARWIDRRNHRGQFVLLPIQSPRGKAHLTAGDSVGLNPVTNSSPSTVVVIQNNSTFIKSDAALRIASQFGGLWRLAMILRWIPRPIRDAVYDWVARHRTAWFGASDRCELPHGTGMPAPPKINYLK
ncbi:MAG: DUF393 domain-containing protein [Deltaproteobacteria bacterium]|nr:DUF393 domain-containing protein [Deltaproteobacteria bacterium]